MIIHPTFTEADRQAIQAIRKVCTVRTIMDMVSAETGVTHTEMRQWGRAPAHLRARDMVCYIAHREGMSYPQIARALGRDQSSCRTADYRERARRGEVAA